MENQTEKLKKKIYEQWWFWILAVIILYVIFHIPLSSQTQVAHTLPTTQSTVQQNPTVKHINVEFYKQAGLVSYIIIPPEDQTKGKLEAICNQIEQESSDNRFTWGFKSERIAEMMDENTDNMTDSQANEWENEIDAGYILNFSRNSKAPINNCVIGVNGWTSTGAETINY